jgi:hypothetical protein
MEIKQIMAAPEKIQAVFFDAEGEETYRADCPVVAVLRDGDADCAMPMIFDVFWGYTRPDKDPFFLGFERGGKMYAWKSELASAIVSYRKKQAEGAVQTI